MLKSGEWARYIEAQRKVVAWLSPSDSGVHKAFDILSDTIQIRYRKYNANLSRWLGILPPALSSFTLEKNMDTSSEYPCS